MTKFKQSLCREVAVLYYFILLTRLKILFVKVCENFENSYCQKSFLYDRCCGHFLLLLLMCYFLPVVTQLVISQKIFTHFSDLLNEFRKHVLERMLYFHCVCFSD